MKAYWIRADLKTATEVNYDGLTDLQRMVGGSIELAVLFPHGDVLFVDDEGLFKYVDFFIIEGGHQPFAGNGVYVGREQSNGGGTRPPRRSLAEVAASVKFVHRAELSHAPGYA